MIGYLIMMFIAFTLHMACIVIYELDQATYGDHDDRDPDEY